MVKTFIKKYWSNFLLISFLALLVFPKTRLPIQVFIQRLVSFSPSETKGKNQKNVEDYNWILREMNSEEINFSQSQGKIIILNFWATWCPPCIAEMPSFQKLYYDYGDKVDFYFVTSEKPKTIKKFLIKEELTLPIYFEVSKAPEILKSEVLPTTFLISKSGKIIIEEEGAADWNSKKMKILLEKLLSE